MSKTQGSGELRPLPFLHALAMLSLAVAWAYYCWRDGPLRKTAAGSRGEGGFIGLEQALGLFTASLGDVLLGLLTVLLFAIGTGIYVRRFQVWLDARSSGETVAYGGADLKDQALAANVNQGRRQ